MNARVVALSVDPTDKSTALKGKLGVKLPLYQDREGKVAKAWGVFDEDAEIALASSFVVAPGGRIIYRFIGTSQRARPPVQEFFDAIERDLRNLKLKSRSRWE